MSYRFGVVVGLLGVLVAAACSSSSDPAPDTGAAGAAGEAGGGNDDPCHSSLSSFCKENKDLCLMTLAQQEQKACQSGQTKEEFTSSCGGKSIVSMQGLGQATYHYDAEGKLVGGSFENDIAYACGSNAISFGAECKLDSASSKHLCPQQPSCMQGDYVCKADGDFSACPATRDTFNVVCPAGDSAYQHPKEFASDCGGTVIEIEGVPARSWTFSKTGELVGTYWVGDVGDSGCWGAPCSKKAGTEGKDLCAGEGGGGAGGAGGMGGAGGEAGSDLGGAGGAKH